MAAEPAMTQMAAHVTLMIDPGVVELTDAVVGLTDADRLRDSPPGVGRDVHAAGGDAVQGGDAVTVTRHEVADSERSRQVSRNRAPLSPHQLPWPEATAITAILLVISLVASGWADAMLPWVR